MKIPAPNFTQTPNDLFDHWLPHLSEAELKVLLVIMRKTFGWHKMRDKISISQLSQITGMLEETVIKAAKSLHNKGVILRQVVGPVGKQETYYELVVSDDSNNSYPSVQPTGPLGLDPHGSTESQKKDFYTKETTTNKAAAPPAAVPLQQKLYPCLESLDIPESDKYQIAKAYPEDVVKNAVAWATHPETKINKSLAQAIKWACKEKPPVPKMEKDVFLENRAAAEKIIQSIKVQPNYINIEILGSRAEIVFTSQKDPICIEFKEKCFKEMFIGALRKVGVVLNT